MASPTEMTYVVLRRVRVGGEDRHEGDLVPEANNWHNVEAYIRTGRIASVPRATVDQEELAAAEDRAEALAERNRERARRRAPEPEEVSEEVEELTEEHTAEELYEQAQDLDVEGRSSMDKEELAEAVVETESEIEQYHTGQGWYEVPGADKKMRRDEALDYLTSPEGEEE